MTADPLEIVLDYHNRTKHAPGRYARSLGYLDWANQPDPFRRFYGAALHRLPIPEEQASPAYDELFAPGAVKPQPLNVESVSTLFYLSLALSAWKQAGTTTWALRCNPSSGNLHPTEGYAILPAITGLDASAGVYHYAPREHALEQRARLGNGTFEKLLCGCLEPGAQGADVDGLFLVGLTSIYWREAWKYGERAFRYCQHDVGHALAALRLAAAFLGWRLLVLEQSGDQAIASLLGLDRKDDFANAEAEAPDLLALVGPENVHLSATGGPSEKLAEEVSRNAQWFGKANSLSVERVHWDIINSVHEATVKEHSAHASTERRGIPAARIEMPTSSRRAVSAFKIIRTRRSALAFDGRTGMQADDFYAMLARTMPAPDCAPFDCISSQPCVHLFMFVHRVSGLEPGLYVLVRNPDKTPELQQACDAQFRWSVPVARPSGLPLYMLLPADCRLLATQLSLGQEIAGESAVSLGMVAEFEPTLRRYGSWFYKRLFWEAGLIGQVLYLEAEAVGLRATGIGAYFDDLVHETLGISTGQFQSLYHFTIGGHLEDPRLAGRPTYPARIS